MSVVVLTGQELQHVWTAAPSFTVLYSFTGADGVSPIAGLTRDSAGNLYGTTVSGGTSTRCTTGPGCGTVFKLSATGAETLLHSFAGGPTDGLAPYAGLVRDAAGSLYGTTAYGNPSNGGVVFKVSATGTETVLLSFTDYVTGAAPTAALIEDVAGNFYGTASGGGAFNNGVVFKLSPRGTETVLYSFTGGADGGSPQAGLVRDAAGNLYGTTFYGGFTGSEACDFGCGVVFKLSPAGTYTVLHSFAGGSDGANPFAGLTRDSAGNLYGTTQYGGVHGNGVVFKLSPAGTETVLHRFTGGADGGNAVAGLAQDGLGNLYGTTQYGGAACSFSSGITCGVVFKLSSCGSGFKVLHTFTGGADGGLPTAGLIQDPAGNLYGTTSGGGVKSDACFNVHCGVVFKLTP
jgi:uncharacterized repeat protein (TIGR03803 family)